MNKLRRNLLTILPIALIAVLLASTVFFYLRSKDTDCQITIGKFTGNGQDDSSIDLSLSRQLSGADMAIVLNALISAEETEISDMTAEDPCAVILVDFPPMPEYGTKFLYVWMTEDSILISSDPDEANAAYCEIQDTTGSFRELLTKTLEPYSEPIPG